VNHDATEPASPSDPAQPPQGSHPSPSSADFTVTLDLVRRAQGGEEDARERLVTRYLNRVLRAVRARMGSHVRRQCESGDIVQEAFIVALRRLDDFEIREEATFLSWMRTIVENQIRDKAKGIKRQADRGRQERRIITDEDFAEADQPSPLAQVAQSEETGFVDDCVHSLEERYRDLLLLRDYDGHSWDEIARRMELPSPDAARMQHKTALARLARAMDSAGRSQSSPS